MATTRSTRKRAKGSDAEGTSQPKKPKNVKWEWLGDGGKWTPYMDDVNDTLTNSFVSGADEITTSVSERVKMKIQYKQMCQRNVTTGWSRDIRCVSRDQADTQSSNVEWEWEDMNGVWERYPKNTSRHLEAAILCGLKEINISLSGTSYVIDTEGENMEIEGEEGTKYKMRRVELEDDYIWQWKDDLNVWNDYLQKDSQAIESSYNSGDVIVNIATGGWSYSLDLMKMEQINAKTKKVRKIRRNTKGSTHSLVDKKPAVKDVVRISMSVSESGHVNKVVRRTPRQIEDKNVKVIRKNVVKSESNEEESDDEVKVKPKTLAASEDIKSQVFTGSAPVDSECTQKIGKAKVYSDNNGDIWDSMLNQTNLKNNNNKFYLLQLLVDNNKPNYSVWFRWGRVGKVGQSQLHAFGNDLESAKETFRKKFHEKTHNSWEERHNFVKVAGKYDLLEMDYGSKEEVDAPSNDSPKVSLPNSKLHDKVQQLIELICDVNSMEEVIKEMKYDTKKAPLGKLTTSQIKFGFTALKKIESLVKSNNIKGDQIYKACDEFYTRIPHDFGMKRPPLITTTAEIKEKVALLEALSDIQIAMTILQKDDKENDMHPIDRHYNELDCEIISLSPDNEMYDLIRKYVKQTHGKTHTSYKLEVEEIFEIKKRKEIANYKDIGNKQLLWHGSRLTNWMGILSSGLRIAPPEAPVTGHMFGKGLYFANISSKSANYCFATPSRNTGLLLLSEVSLGTCNELLAADYEAHCLPKGTHSVKGCGRIEPNPTQNHTLSDGCVIPLGTPIDTGVSNTGGYTLNYSEFIVYDTAQTKMKYLVQLKFIFK